MIYLSPGTLEKYENGYHKASTILSDYLPESDNKLARIIAEKTGTEYETEPEPETGFTTPEYFRFWTIREYNKMISAKLIEETAKKPPKGSIQTGQVNRSNGLPYARIYTCPKTGRIYAVTTGY